LSGNSTAEYRFVELTPDGDWPALRSRRKFPGLPDVKVGVVVFGGGHVIGVGVLRHLGGRVLVQLVVRASGTFLARGLCPVLLKTGFARSS
jgi:hypothetical protein